MSPTWTVIWMFLTTFSGVLAAACLAWQFERRKRLKERAERSNGLTRVLREGLQRNIVVLRQMRGIANGDGGRLPDAPSQRIDRAHFDATIVSAVDLLAAEPNQYGTLLNASYMAAHINRRAQVLEEIEWMPLQPHPVVGSERDILKQRHCRELVGHIDKALPSFESILSYLGDEVPGEFDGE